MNRIVEIRCSLQLPAGHWLIEVTKAFSPENGGGTYTFQETAPDESQAVEVAKLMTAAAILRNPAQIQNGQTQQGISQQQAYGQGQNQGQTQGQGNQRTFSATAGGYGGSSY